MSSSRVWLRQAKSDLSAARYLAAQNADDLYCQIAAKCQQAVEKSVKAIAAELTERRFVDLTIGFDHRIDQYIAAIIRAPRRGKNSVLDYIQQMLRYNRNEINAIMQLAPHRPPDANQLPRNTEYPFHDVQGILIAPADTGIFQKTETDSHLKVAGVVFDKAKALISITEREPR